MPPKTRQQRRAKSRSPLKRKGRGARTFMFFMMVVLFGGSGLIYLARANPPPLTRGASAGEHWHANYKIYICGRQMTNFPTPPGEYGLATHSDAFVHLHPTSAAESGDQANLATFLRTYETSIGTDAKGKRQLAFPPVPTGERNAYADGDSCSKKDKKKHEIVVTNKGKQVEGDPGDFILHDGDALEIRFGKKGKKPLLNPYSLSKGIPDVGFGGDKPAPDGGAPADAPPAEAQPEPSAEPSTSDSKKESSKKD